jgi:RNase P subunit RPR2
MIRLGGRTLLAATCRRCGKLLPGTAFRFHIRNQRDRIAYVDQRCTNCKWGMRVKGKRLAE